MLDQPPAIALGLDEYDGDFYAGDVTGKPIEDLVPDYGILDRSTTNIRYATPTSHTRREAASGNATSAACLKLEGAQRDATPLTEFVRGVDEMYGPRRDLMLMDNNVVASARFKEIIAEIRDLGFTPGAKLKRAGERVAVTTTRRLQSGR